MRFYIKNKNLFPMPGNSHLIHMATVGYGLRAFIVMIGVSGIVKGKAYIITNHRIDGDPFDGAYIHHLHKENPFTIPKRTWHSGRNDSDEAAHIIEIWKGNSKYLSEDDIERWD